MKTVQRIVVVGSGPAGIAAARALLERGLNVTMLEAAAHEFSVTPIVERPSIRVARESPSEGRFLLGDEFSGLKLAEGQSPKLRTDSVVSEATEVYADNNFLEARNFHLIGANVTGGLSRVWGAVASTFDDQDMQGWPIGLEDLRPSYERVCAAIGISGSDDDAMADAHGRGLPLQPPIQLSTNAKRLLMRYAARPPRDFMLGRARHAVLSTDLGARKACNLCLGCVWGCPRDSIYDGAVELAALSQRRGFLLLNGCRVDSIERSDDGYRIVMRTREGIKRLDAHHVVLAAGTLPTTRLALKLLERVDEAQPLITNPAAAFAVWQPGRLGNALDREGMGLVQLSLRLPIDGTADFAMGQLYEGQAFAASDLTWAMPMTRPGANTLMRALLPGLQVGLLYLPGSLTRNTVRLRHESEGQDVLAIEGAYVPEFADILRAAGKRMRRAFRGLGAFVLPGSLRAYLPGAEVHYAGTLPMGRRTTPDGQLMDADGVYVVDGSVLPSLPAKHLTLTVMANADRIAHGLATRLVSA